jgi:hypothetical protein
MREIASKENVSLLGVSGALTMHALGKLAPLSRGALTGAQVAGELLNRNVVAHYAEALRSLRQKGLYPLVRESAAVYAQAVWQNFAPHRQTWTAELVSGRLFRRAARALADRWNARRRSAPIAADPPAVDSAPPSSPEEPSP